MIALAFHLHHGIWSLFQTLGANHPHVNGLRVRLAWFLSVFIPLGFVSVPLGVLFGMVR
jgi:succinate dehydrogenase / fumarate reductase cytochrome b subunit